MQAIKCVVVGDGASSNEEMDQIYEKAHHVYTYVQRQAHFFRHAVLAKLNIQPPIPMTNQAVKLANKKNMVIMIDDTPYNLGLWDTAGQEEYDRLRALCYPQTEVFLVCFSIVDPSSFNNIKQRWWPEIKHLCPDTPFILIGTKLDLRSDEKVLADLEVRGESVITTERGKKLADEIGASAYHECSALTQKGLKLAFQEAANVFVKGHLVSSKMALNVEPKKKKKNCTLF